MWFIGIFTRRHNLTIYFIMPLLHPRELCLPFLRFFCPPSLSWYQGRMCILITSVTTIIYDDRNYRKKCQVSLIGRGTGNGSRPRSRGTRRRSSCGTISYSFRSIPQLHTMAILCVLWWGCRHDQLSAFIWRARCIPFTASDPTKARGSITAIIQRSYINVHINYMPGTLTVQDVILYITINTQIKRDNAQVRTIIINRTGQ